MPLRHDGGRHWEIRYILCMNVIKPSEVSAVPDQRTRGMLLNLPIELADRLEFARYLRQRRVGRPVPKKALVLEAIERFLNDTA